MREGIERLERHLRVLKDRVSLSTITINCREQKEYEPPESPTFASRVGGSWNDSIGALRDLTQAIVVALTAVVPWIVPVGLPMWAAWKVVQRRVGAAHMA